MRIRAWLILVPGLLSACVTSGGLSDCGAEAYQSLVGQPLSALEAQRPAEDFKVDRPTPDGTVTLEEFPDRLRVTVDGQDRILNVFCG
ncbi:I78 family peptidase inhibitor [Tabrizicola sp.]|uniref:I78 family peptidase inhibitor n=1 Tax=Tabrizicola sp. TaxID=2005166 RepID=UPI00273706B4|nr:I78 family peptidase inhibitor [Tabrizicola sp.]MDP3198141.1 I78 family peptidase inhibitor [Tabrizicola sp.]